MNTELQKFNRFDLTSTVKVRLASYKVHMAEYHKANAKYKVALKKAHEYFDKNVPMDEADMRYPYARVRHFYRFLETDGLGVLRLQKIVEAHWNEARKVCPTRELHLAHSYLKGRTYLECERTCREFPSASAIAECFPLTHTYDANRVKQQRAILTECIQDWVKGGSLTRMDIEAEGLDIQAIQVARTRIQNLETRLSDDIRHLDQVQDRVQQVQRDVPAYEVSIQSLKDELVKARQTFDEARAQLEANRAAKASKLVEASNQ